MKKDNLLNKKGGIFTLLELLVVTAIVCFLAYKAFTSYFGGTSLDKETKKSLTEQAIDTTGPIKILDSTKDIIKKSDKRTLEQ